ncbi:SGNH/GDSL hydrolase family protein [Mesorhizobium sp. RP14(2022)]|uniref:SGNH/GDSL hydrolase family protein n=1 Tax=Mesorhizobium liriopis TaxID=2953882 RepID=A0ABT1C749_9HYPH|nr:SGNH/GDSL hydrolase family protein [Mesorhizobium liriopis]MCO6050587.1 SGNH/GDSL hydrolase family protein [Mesorhizobium liriopis]
MKTILAYGDSLTWGYSASGPTRHAYADRWPSVLQAELGEDFHVIAEGLNGRTTIYDDHGADCDRNGMRLLPTVLETHKPLDLVILFLGSNDMKPWIAGRALAARQGMERLIELIRGHAYGFEYAVPKILLVSPPALCRTEDEDFAEMFEAIEESQKLAGAYAKLAKQLGISHFDAGSVAQTTPLDGVHMDAENTRAVGRALAPLVRDILNS